ITGTFFTTTGASVKFGSANATSFTVDSGTQITAVAPATIALGVVDITVTNSTAATSATGAADRYTYTAVTPTVASINPTSGPTGGGTTVTITGTNFIIGATVSFGATAATGVVVNSATSITAVSPATVTPGQVDVRVTTSGGTSAIVAGDHFTYTAVAPAVTAVSPNTGPTTGGTSVTITGTNFITG